MDSENKIASPVPSRVSQWPNVTVSAPETPPQESQKNTHHDGVSSSSVKQMETTANHQREALQELQDKSAILALDTWNFEMEPTVSPHSKTETSSAVPSAPLNQQSAASKSRTNNSRPSNVSHDSSSSSLLGVKPPRHSVYGSSSSSRRSSIDILKRPLSPNRSLTSGAGVDPKEHSSVSSGPLRSEDIPIIPLFPRSASRDSSSGEKNGQTSTAEIVNHFMTRVAGKGQPMTRMTNDSGDAISSLVKQFYEENPINQYTPTSYFDGFPGQSIRRPGSIAGSISGSISGALAGSSGGSISGSAVGSMANWPVPGSRIQRSGSRRASSFGQAAVNRRPSYRRNSEAHESMLPYGSSQSLRRGLQSGPDSSQSMRTAIGHIEDLNDKPLPLLVDQAGNAAVLTEHQVITEINECEMRYSAYMKTFRDAMEGIQVLRVMADKIVETLTKELNFTETKAESQLKKLEAAKENLKEYEDLEERMAAATSQLEDYKKRLQTIHAMLREQERRKIIAIEQNARRNGILFLMFVGGLVVYLAFSVLRWFYR